VDFPSVVNAVQCAQQIQSQLREHNAEKAKHERRRALRRQKFCSSCPISQWRPSSEIFPSKIQRS
jgi:hypothetical protein